MLSLYILETASKHPVTNHNIPEEQKSLLCLQIYCLLFRNNWLSLHVIGRVETISSLCSSQWVSIDAVSSVHVLSVFFLEPGVAPELNATKSVSDRTNSSFAVHWQPPQNCTSFNGYLYKYRFQLLSHNSSTLLREGLTQLTSATFSGLTPLTMYTVRVYLVTSGGWNPKHPLEISAQTKVTS
jgi:hypothetical protein